MKVKIQCFLLTLNLRHNIFRSNINRNIYRNFFTFNLLLSRILIASQKFSILTIEFIHFLFFFAFSPELKDLSFLLEGSPDDVDLCKVSKTLTLIYIAASNSYLV